MLSQRNGRKTASPSIQYICFLTQSRFYISSHSLAANMQVSLLQFHAFFTLFSLYETLFLSNSIHYSFYAPGHRSVPKESKGSYGKYIHMHIWYSWQISIKCKCHSEEDGWTEGRKEGRNI